MGIWTDQYGDGTKLPKLHEDREIDLGEKLADVFLKLDLARAALLQGIDLNLISEPGQAFKRQARWVMEMTAPGTVGESHPNCG